MAPLESCFRSKRKVINSTFSCEHMLLAADFSFLSTENKIWSKFFWISFTTPHGFCTCLNKPVVFLFKLVQQYQSLLPLRVVKCKSLTSLHSQNLGSYFFKEWFYSPVSVLWLVLFLSSDEQDREMFGVSFNTPWNLSHWSPPVIASGDLYLDLLCEEKMWGMFSFNNSPGQRIGI